MIIFGTRTSAQLLAILTFVCNYCHNPAAQRVFKRVTRFTLFFIPLFPVSTTYHVDCVFCGLSTPIVKDLADTYVAHAQAVTAAQPAPTQPDPANEAG